MAGFAVHRLMPSEHNSHGRSQGMRPVSAASYPIGGQH